MGAEYLATTAIRSPDRRTRSEMLYRLGYAGPQNYSQTCRQTQMHQARFETQIYVMGYPSEKLRAQEQQVPRRSQACELNVERSA
jgi:23S rRNA A2030 N6-methylase RlmJ